MFFKFGIRNHITRLSEFSFVILEVISLWTDIFNKFCKMEAEFVQNTE